MGSCCSAALASGARRPRRPSSGAWSRSSRRGWPPWAPAAWRRRLCAARVRGRSANDGAETRAARQRTAPCPLAPALGARGTPRAPRRSTRSRSEPGLRHTRTSAARLVTDVMVIVVLGTAPLDVSMLAFLAHVRSARGLSRPSDVRGRAQEWRVRGGTGLIAERLADGLAGKVRFDSPVRVVRRWARAASCSIRARDRSERAARSSQWIPRLVSRLRFEPGLPARHGVLCGRSRMGTGITVHVGYPRPVWRDAGLRGQAMSDGEPRPAHA